MIKTHKEFIDEINKIYGGKVIILNTYESLKTRMSFQYNCDKHGIINNNYSASTLLYSKTFQPCKLCTKEKHTNNCLHSLENHIVRSWKVIKYYGNQKWQCECIYCGNIRIVPSQMLREDKVKDCICRDYLDIIGTKVGRLTILGCIKKNNTQQSILCLCDCGNKKYINISDLKKKNPTQSCGCISKERTKKVKENGLIDITGKKYGKWNVIKYAGKGKWLCECECGNKKKVNTASLNNGDTLSCGKCYENTVNSNFFDQIDTEEKAYILGLLYADGYNNEKKKLIRLDLQEDDVNILVKIKEIMKFEGNIKYYQNEDKIFQITGTNKKYKCKDTARLLIHNTRLSEQLALKGCTNNKTYNIVFPNKEVLPVHLYKHFIRGLIDGDGSITYWIDNKKTGHKKFSIGLTGTTELINDVCNIVTDQFDCKPVLKSRYPERNNNNLSLNICGNRIIEKILGWIYGESTIYLNRKFEKYLELKKMNNQTTYNQTNKYCMKKVMKLDVNYNLIKQYKSLQETISEDYCPASIVLACKGKFKNNSHLHKGFLWYYSDDIKLNDYNVAEVIV